MTARQVFLGLLAVMALCAAPSVQAHGKVTDATVCEVAKDPAAFDNKFVRLRATLVEGFEISAIEDPQNRKCGALWFTYPGSGPEAMMSISGLLPTVPRPAVHLKRNHQFKRFQKLADAKMYPRQERALCEGCNRYELTSLMVGLVEFAGPGRGFGHMNSFPVQFVLKSVERTSVSDLASRYNVADFSAKPVHFARGHISGTLRDPEGRPVADADLNVYSTTNPPAYIDNDSATTNKKGHFKFDLSPGKYIIGFNTFWPPSAQFPFPPTYYPSTTQRSAASVVVVADKQHVLNLVLKLPRRLALRTIPVKVLWPDGQPVANANVWLSELSDPTSVVGLAVSHTAADGTFNLMGLQGIDYILHADKYGGFARVSCAKNILIRAGDVLPSRIQLSLTRTDFDVCKNIDFEIPPEAVVRK
jgi:hypothetical protein